MDTSISHGGHTAEMYCNSFEISLDHVYINYTACLFLIAG